MSIIHVDNLKENMVLSDDVTDLNARLLLTRGLKIQAKHIRILKTWGITEINVVTAEPDHEESATKRTDPESLGKIEESTKYLFCLKAKKIFKKPILKSRSIMSKIQKKNL
jgi:hypothetical protein